MQLTWGFCCLLISGEYSMNWTDEYNYKLWCNAQDRVCTNHKFVNNYHDKIWNEYFKLLSSCVTNGIRIKYIIIRGIGDHRKFQIV